MGRVGSRRKWNGFPISRTVSRPHESFGAYGVPLIYSLKQVQQVEKFQY